MSNASRRNEPFGLADAYHWLLSLRQTTEHHGARLTELGQSVKQVAASLREVQEAVARLEIRRDGADGATAALEAEINRLSLEIAALTEEHDDLDGRFTQVLAARATAAPGAAATARHVEHQEIAERFRTFIDQEMTSAARAAVLAKRRRALRRPEPDQEQIAERLAELCRAMFGGPDIDEARLRGLLEEAPDWPVRLAATGAELRWRARAASPEGTWDFEAKPGQPADAQSQRVWGEYRPDGNVAGVVAPAYVVAGRVYEPQRVTTHSH
ncbi:hypothetical protein [Dactylosporangium sp. NPDC049140]|uniref:hypothetical protein n=1 Tax=Dactylosporangium sp. NPDC049140 TaxID=3155647 RepID=UPI00340AEB50